MDEVMSDTPKPVRGKKYNATRMDIVNDFYDEIQLMIAKYADKPDALAALDDIEAIAIWWANAPAVVHPTETDPPVNARIAAFITFEKRIASLEKETTRQKREIRELKQQVKHLSVRSGHETIRNMLVGGNTG